MVIDEPRRAEFPADRESPGKARRFASRFAITCGADPHAVALCVSEAVTNALRHGYRDRSDLGPIGVELRIVADGADLQVCVEDHGQGLSPRSDSPGIGLGLPLIAAMAARMDVETGEDGTRVCMCFPASHGCDC